MTIPTSARIAARQPLRGGNISAGGCPGDTSEGGGEFSLSLIEVPVALYLNAGPSHASTDPVAPSNSWTVPRKTAGQSGRRACRYRPCARPGLEPLTFGLKPGNT